MLLDGSTMYVQANGKTVREYLYNSALEEFSSTPIKISKSFNKSPTDSILLQPCLLEQNSFIY